MCSGEIFHIAGEEHRHTELSFGYPNVSSGKTRTAINRIYGLSYPLHLAKLRRIEEEKGVEIGFKIMTAQFRYKPFVVQYLKWKRAKMIFLYRESTHDSAKSHVKAVTTGVWSSLRPDAAKRGDTNAHGHADFEEILSRHEKQKDTIIRLHKMHGGMLISYEEMIEKWDDVSARLGSYIGVPDLKMEMSIEKLG